MNIKELKEKIKDLPDDMTVCGCGHYGEELDIYFISVNKVGKGVFGDKGKFQALIIDMEDKGEPPD